MIFLTEIHCTFNIFTIEDAGHANIEQFTNYSILNGADMKRQ